VLVNEHQQFMLFTREHRPSPQQSRARIGANKPATQAMF
jgi:hypothetical protein